MYSDTPSRRTPAELRVLYEVQPQLRDVVVEGRTDASVIRWYLRERGVNNAKIYAVDDRVEIDSASVLGVGGEVGARGRVLALADEAARWMLTQENLTCVIDSDRDCLASRVEFPHLLSTDFGSMDVYAFQPRPLQQFIDVVVCGFDRAEDVMADLVPTLNETFLIRAALHEVGRVPLIATFVNCCNTRKRPIALDADELVRRSLAVVSAGCLHGEVMARVDRYRDLPAEPLLAVRGHDIAPLLIKRLGLKNDLARSESVERSLRACLTTTDLDESRLFSQLRDRLGLI